MDEGPLTQYTVGGGTPFTYIGAAALWKDAAPTENLSVALEASDTNAFEELVIADKGEQEDPGTYSVTGLLIAKSGATLPTGSWENASVVVEAAQGSWKEDDDTEAYISGILQTAGNVYFTGEKSEISINANAVNSYGDGGLPVAAYQIEGDPDGQTSVTFAAQKTVLSAESTQVFGIAYGLLAAHNETGNSRTISFEGATEISADGGNDNYGVGNAVCIGNYIDEDKYTGSGKINLTFGSTAKLSATGKDARGLSVSLPGETVFKGETTIDVTANNSGPDDWAPFAAGVYVYIPETAASTDKPSVSFEGITTITAHSQVTPEETSVIGVAVGSGSVTFSGEKTTITATGGDAGGNNAVAVSGEGSSASFIGGTTILTGDVIVTDGASLTLANKVSLYGKMNTESTGGTIRFEDNAELSISISNMDSSSLTGGSLIFGENTRLVYTDETYELSEVEEADSYGATTVVFAGTPTDASSISVDDAYDYGSLHLRNVDLTTKRGEDGLARVSATGGYRSLIVQDAHTVLINDCSPTFTLYGSADGEVIQFEDVGSDQAKTVTIAGTSLTLGGDDKSGGRVNATVNVDGGMLTVKEGVFSIDQVNIDPQGLSEEPPTYDEYRPSDVWVKEGSLSIGTLEGTGRVYVGSENSAGTLAVDTLNYEGTIFIDPAWIDGAEVTDASWFTVQNVSQTGLVTDIVVGRSSYMAFGADKEAGAAAFEGTGLEFGEGKTEAILYVAKPLMVGEGSIVVDGSLQALPATSAAEGSITLGKNALMLVNVEGVNAQSEAPVKATSFTVSDTSAKIALSNATAGQKGTLVSVDNPLGNIDYASLAAESSKMIAFTLSEGTDGTSILFETSLTGPADSNFDNLEPSDLMDEIFNNGKNDVDSDDPAIKFLSRLDQHENYGVQSTDEAVKITNQVSALAVTSGVYNIALDASDLLTRSINRRTSVAGIHDHTLGKSVWADVFATRNRANDLYGNGGYETDIYGGVLGADFEVAEQLRIGAAISAGTANGGSRQAAVDIDNDADFFGLRLYADKCWGDFAAKIDAGYMSTKSEISGSAFAMGISDDVEVEAYTAGLRAEYVYPLASMDVVPHVGLRWTHLHVSGYDSVFKTDSDSMDIYTAPIGVALKGKFEVDGVKIAPVFDLSVVPSFGDDEATSTIRWGSAVDVIKTKVVDDAPVQASLGLEVQSGNWTTGIAYDLGLGGDERFNNAFTARFRYSF